MYKKLSASNNEKKKENIHDGSIKQHNNYKTQTGKKN